MYNAKLNRYKNDALKTQLASADPYQVIQMLMAGAIDNLNLAKASIERNEKENKSHFLSKAGAIITSLAHCLDHEAGGEVSQNLEALYVYMSERLIEANVENNGEMVEEVMSLLKEIKSGWDAIPVETRNNVFAQKESQASQAANT
ncbi:flagellar export chaperone FliS [Thalassotalea sp. LPB0316]|uniref:flagellar export chaperone FliS n=1 Tax=Thalassotalea sp. LPB0316 TaxID=2769490 RepID=UPI001865FE0A|nr:flagellar export chaperone FliS [Thalassotalea sp. LPB0316]QOL27077.1 flagellar export chaperone FliS [Thalassotalea sp. LPB0316]